MQKLAECNGKWSSDGLFLLLLIRWTLYDFIFHVLCQVTVDALPLWTHALYDAVISQNFSALCNHIIEQFVASNLSPDAQTNDIIAFGLKR